MSKSYGYAVVPAGANGVLARADGSIVLLAGSDTAKRAGDDALLWGYVERGLFYPKALPGVAFGAVFTPHEKIQEGKSGGPGTGATPPAAQTQAVGDGQSPGPEPGRGAPVETDTSESYDRGRRYGRAFAGRGTVQDREHLAAYAAGIADVLRPACQLGRAAIGTTEGIWDARPPSPSLRDAVAELSCSPPAKSQPCELGRWTITVDDGFALYEFVFQGRSDTSIEKVAGAARNHLNATETSRRFVKRTGGTI